ncbi:MAG TPA: hypothetical protein VKQ07_02080 [Jatrophihabitantaceae bacterium]|nr:hypothetical protein [Jatrophihabitantaceae bacterium]
MSDRGGARWLAVAVAAASIALLGACGQTTAGHANPSLNPTTLPVLSSLPTPTVVQTTLPASSSASSSASASTHPVPAKPLRTATVSSNGHNYVLEIWAEVKDVTCADHAYGQVATFLTTHPCRGMTRQLATTSVNGKAVGFAVSAVDVPGSDAQHLYDNAAAFSKLVEADGTGNVNDLMREGWRLPSGPASVPSPDAFKTLSQDTGVNIYDIWYLAGPTPTNDPALVQMAQDIYLQY